MIKLFDPYFGKEEENVLNDVLNSGYWASGSGEGKVKEFEDEFRKYIGSDACVALNSGTAALHLALLQYDIVGKEVLVPSMTFVSTVHSIIYSSAKPVFVDVEENTLCIDINDLEKKITKNSALIIPVHFGGMPCDLKSLNEIVKEKKIDFVEDAAHAVGSTYDNKKIGTHTKSVCFSFHPIKNLSMPNGGAITLNGDLTEKRKKTIFSQRWCGIDDRKGVFYDVSRLGWNYYMNEFSAAIGLVQLKKLDSMNIRRKTIAKKYYEKLLTDKKMPISDNCNYHLYWIRVKNRHNFIKKMKESNIEIGIHYKPIHMMNFYSSSQSLKKTEEIWEEIVSLPMHVNLSDDDVNYVIEKTNQFLE